MERYSINTQETQHLDHLSTANHLLLPPTSSFALRSNMYINVYGVHVGNEVIYPTRVSSTLVPDRYVDILLFERDGVHHYTIKYFSRSVGRQLSNHGHTVHCCRGCLHAYSSQELLDAHAQRTKFPKDPRCRFTNIQKPFAVYAGVESILQRVDEDEAMDTTHGVAVGGDEPTPAAGPFQEHLSCSFAYKMVASVVPDFSRPLFSYRGEDAGEMFVRKLQEEVEQTFREYIAPTLPVYDARRPKVNLIYLDGNNLYGLAMSQPLPTHGFRFLQPDDIEALEVGELSDNAEDGYIFEVDLSYPQHLHDAPVSLKIGRDMYSPAQQAVFPQTAPQRKLTPNLRDKVRYVIHYRNLKLYLKLGTRFLQGRTESGAYATVCWSVSKMLRFPLHG